MNPSDFLTPALRARLRDLRLWVRRGARGQGFGQHASRNRGSGLDFAQYRAYEPGDEPRRIDWKLFARSDRWYVRESEQDSPLVLWVLVDATASMRQRDADGGPDKLHAATIIAACAVELAVRQGDTFALLAIGGAAPCVVPPGSGSRHRDRVLHALASIGPAGAWPDAQASLAVAEPVAESALVLMLSDFFDDAAVELAERFARARRDVAAVEVIAACERDFPFAGAHRFVDPETGAERRVDAAAVRADYLARFGAARAERAARFRRAGIRHTSHVLGHAEDAPLRALFGPASSLDAVTTAAPESVG